MEAWLYIVLLGVAALLYGWLLPRRDDSKKTEEALVKKMEAALEQYMADIEQENEELIKLVAQMKEDYASRLSAVQEQIVELGQRVVELERSAHPTNEEPSAEQETIVPRETIRDRYAELVTLYDAGKSLDSISRQTGIQRGEVQLILQLAEREGRHG